MFNLMPKDTVFFDLFENLSRHAVSCAEHLRQLAKQFPNIDDEVQRIRDEEHKADDLTHKALERLDQTDVLVQATVSLSEAVHKIRKSRKLSELKDILIEIHRLESVGDDNNHSAISNLYDGSVEALEVLKWKELYDYIEEAIDGCEDVGNTLERIVLKNG